MLCESLASWRGEKSCKLAVACSGGAVLWGDSSGHAAVIEGAEADDMITALTLSSDGSTLAVAYHSKAVMLYAASEAGGVEEPGKFILPKKATALVLAEGGGAKVLLVADRFGDVVSYPRHTAELPKGKHCLGHTASAITTMRLTADGKYLITGDRAEHVRVSNFPNTALIQSFLGGHTSFVTAVATIPGRNRALVTAAADGMVGVWDILTGERQVWLQIVEEGVFPTGVSCSASVAAVALGGGGGDGKVLLYKGLENAPCALHLSDTIMLKKDAAGVAFLGELLVVAVADGQGKDCISCFSINSEDKATQVDLEAPRDAIAEADVVAAAKALNACARERLLQVEDMKEAWEAEGSSSGSLVQKRELDHRPRKERRKREDASSESKKGKESSS
ncbi:unnamed protein product [Chrysoparadoxa australica]